MSKKIPLILLPAFMSTRTQWLHQVEGLSDIADCAVIELAPYASVKDMAAAVLEKAPKRFALAGLSLGAFTAFEIMRQAPERVDRLALISTSSNGDEPQRTAGRKAQIATVREGKFNEVVDGFLDVLQSEANPWSPELRETVRKMVCEVGPEGFLRQQDAMWFRPAVRDSLPAISCPTVVIHGRDDRSWPVKHAYETALGIPGSRLVLIDNAGHFPTMDSPEETTAAMRDWLLS